MSDVTGPAALEALDLAVTRGGRRILGGLSFGVRPGRALILRGPNGIGKTTLLRCLAGLQPPAAGAVVAPPETLALATHADGVKSALTVTENLAFWAALFGRPDRPAAVGRAIETLDLAALADRPAATLSAGQRRRLGLARLLVTGRRTWLLDEPTVSLDAASTDRFAATLRAHMATGGAVIAATHVPLGLDAEELDLAPFRPVVAADAADPFGGDWT